MNLERRLAIEDRLLRQHFPGFHIQDLGGGPNPGVVGTLTTNSGRRYALWIPLAHFPSSAPPMYVISPSLETYEGDLLADQGLQSDMHLLSPDEHGHVQICHHNDTYWSPELTLYRVVLKGRIWLEAYESHLRTGKPIDHYLSHM